MLLSLIMTTSMPVFASDAGQFRWEKNTKEIPEAFDEAHLFPDMSAELSAYEQAMEDLFQSYYRQSAISYQEEISFLQTDLREYVSPYASGISALATLNYASDSYNWGGHATILFTVNGYIAYCLNPQMLQPGPGTYSDAYVTAIPASANMRLAKVLYYGYGGPVDVTASLYGSWEERTAITHVAAAAAYGDSAPYYGLNSGAVAQVQEYLSMVDAKPDLDPGRNTSYILRPDQGMQAIGWLVSSQPSEGNLEIRKASAIPAITD